VDKQVVTPTTIYAPTWQFSQAVKVTGGSLLFVSGIVGYRPDGTLPATMVDQAEQAYRNLAEVLRAAGGALADIVKVTVFVGDDYAAHRDEMREIRARFFDAPFPASTLIQVAGFANPDYRFEIEAVAALDPSGGASGTD